MCILSSSKHAGEELIHFYLALPLFSLNFPLSLLLLAVSLGIACMPGGWLKELVRLSSQGFHLVILPLGIHTTLLPPEAACLNTDSLKETSHCHFNSRSRSLRLLSALFCFSFCSFLAYSLLCCLSSSLPLPSLCLPTFCLSFL